MNELGRDELRFVQLEERPVGMSVSGISLAGARVTSDKRFPPLKKHEKTTIAEKQS